MILVFNVHTHQTYLYCVLKYDLHISGKKRKKAVDISTDLITERNTYICDTCDRKFNRCVSINHITRNT